ncbi:MAG: hypothetical protein F6K42_09810 [Leptolyngbya sp. SIO1D8]|nr:hypothetical protein [Leptolyngbya sp. SIO1D8]
MDVLEINRWFPPEQQQSLINRLIQRVGVTRVRAECFVRLWIYLLVKQYQAQGSLVQPPLEQLVLPTGAVVCTHREAADLFYSDKEQGSDRAAGMMLDKLAALGLIKKYFDGNTTSIEIQPTLAQVDAKDDAFVDLIIDDFDPRCDTIPIANLLATNYNWMNSNQDALPHRIARILRGWANHYAVGMRVLRRSDNLNPVGFYLLYPTASESDANFFGPASKGLHLSTLTEVDPFKMATVGDPNCVSVFARSWMIDPLYRERYRVLFLQDVQTILIRMRQDFPNLWDIHTLIIHPSYEALASALGFQRTSREPQTSVYWMYLAIDRFLALDVETAISKTYSQSR